MSEKWLKFVHHAKYTSCIIGVIFLLPFIINIKQTSLATCFGLCPTQGDSFIIAIHFFMLCGMLSIVGYYEKKRFDLTLREHWNLHFMFRYQPLLLSIFIVISLIVFLFAALTTTNTLQ